MRNKEKKRMAFFIKTSNKYKKNKKNKQQQISLCKSIPSWHINLTLHINIIHRKHRDWRTAVRTRGCAPSHIDGFHDGGEGSPPWLMSGKIQCKEIAQRLIKLDLVLRHWGSAHWALETMRASWFGGSNLKRGWSDRKRVIIGVRATKVKIIIKTCFTKTMMTFSQYNWTSQHTKTNGTKIIIFDRERRT